MGPHRIILAAVVSLLIPTLAFATITSVSPSQVNFGSSEEFITIRGTDLTGTVSTSVVFSGPGGTIATEPVVASDDGTLLIVFVPSEVVLTAGSYTIDVYATFATHVTRSGPASFAVIEPPPPEGPPLLSLPEIAVAEANSSRGAIVTWAASAISLDGTETYPVTCTPPSGSFFTLGGHTVVCSASNTFGTSTGSFPVFVTDLAPPVLTLPGNIVTADPVVTFTATATDAIDGDLPVTCNPASGSTFPNGVTTVVCSATDSQVNTTVGSFTVTVTTGAPILVLPGDIVAEATGPGGATVTYDASAIDGTISCLPTSGSTFPLGVTTVTCSATNGIGTTTGSFTVTVQDTTPPNISVANITAEATSAAGAVVTFAPTATDIVSGSVAVLCTPASGSTFALGETTVDCTATDAANNTGTASFTVTVVDTTPPEVTAVTATPNSLWPPDHRMVNIAVSVTATDLTDPAPVSTIIGVSSSQPINGTGDGDTAPDWNVTGDLTLQLRSERSHGIDRIYTITVRTTDLFGNSTISTVEVKVMQAPSKKRAVR